MTAGKTSPGGGKELLVLPSKFSQQNPRNAAAKKQSAKGIASKHQTVSQVSGGIDDSVSPGTLLEDDSVANLTFQNNEVKTELRNSIKENMALKQEIKRLNKVKLDKAKEHAAALKKVEEAKARENAEQQRALRRLENKIR